MQYFLHFICFRLTSLVTSGHSIFLIEANNCISIVTASLQVSMLACGKARLQKSLDVVGGSLSTPTCMSRRQKQSACNSASCTNLWKSLAGSPAPDASGRWKFSLDIFKRCLSHSPDRPATKDLQWQEQHRAAGKSGYDSAYSQTRHKAKVNGSSLKLR